MTQYVYQGEQVVLSTGFDPATVRVPGHLRYQIGLDLGQNDPSAVVILEDQQLPIFHSSGQQRLGPRTRAVVYASRIRDTRYTEIAKHVALLTRTRQLDGRSSLTIDATGVGRAFSDVLTDLGVEHMPVQMTTGLAVNRAGRFWNVSKNVLLTGLASAFETSNLSIAEDLEAASELISELESFQISISKSGAQIFEGGSSSHHADLAIACALAWFRSERASGFIGQDTIDNFY
jgi:hypothetical protein